MSQSAEYEEPDDIWEDFKQAGADESEIRNVLKDFVDGDSLEGRTDLNDAQINLFVVIKSYEASYPGLGLESFAKWFMKLRLSKNRQSRMETVEVLRGRMEMRTREEVEMSRQNRF